MVEDNKSSERPNPRPGQRRGGTGRGRSGPSRRPRTQRSPQSARTSRTRRVIVLVNPQAGQYRESDVRTFVAGAESAGFNVEVLTPSDPHQMVIAAADARKRKPHILVAAGGDGSVNLVARTLIGSPARLGILPLGRFNNIFTSLFGKPSVALALRALRGGYRSIDCGKISEQPFFGSIGIGLTPALAESLENRTTPRFALSWSRLAASAAAGIERVRMPVRVDSYRFDLEPAVISVHLLPRNFGLAFAPSALADDHRFEVTLDMSSDSEPLSKFVREVYKGSCCFDGDIRMYRAEEITIGGVKGRKLYLDGELIDVPTNTLDVRFYSKQLRVCSPDEK